MSWRPRFAVLALVGLTASNALAIDVGPEVDIPGSDLVADPNRPGFAVASCGDRYTVVWAGADGGVHLAQLSSSGELRTGSLQRVSENGHSPSIACSASGGFIAWANNEHTRVLGVRLDAAGAVLDATPIQVRPGYQGTDGVVYPEYAGEQGLGGEIDNPLVVAIGSAYHVTTYGQLIDPYSRIRRTVVFADGATSETTILDRMDGAPGGMSGPSNLAWNWASTAFRGDLLLAHAYAFNPVVFRVWFGASTLQPYVNERGIDTPISVAASDDDYVVAWTSRREELWQYPYADQIRLEATPGVYAFRAVHSEEAGAVQCEEYDATQSHCAATLVAPGEAKPVVFFDGRAHALLWSAPQQGDAGPVHQVFGSLLAVAPLAASQPQPLFLTGAYGDLAVASSGLGVALVAYVDAGANGAGRSVRARLVFTDSEPPSLLVPGKAAAVATRAGGAFVGFAASARDDHAGALQPSCLPASGSLFPPGHTTVTCTAVDQAGNVGVASFDVHVAFSWSGVLPPVRAAGGSVFKLGQAIPVKFQLTGDSRPITDLKARLLLARIVMLKVGPEAPAPPPPLAGNSFRYDAGARQYVFNLVTSGLSPGSWVMRVDLKDGVDRSVRIQLRQ
jgi:hypothetical protein